MNTASPTEFVALNLSLSASERNLLQQAASLTGESIDHFALTALLDRAREVVQTNTVRLLSHRDAVRFLELLDADVEPNDALRRAAECYRGGHE